MCEAISGVLTKDHVFFGKTDSHEDIIEQHKLYEGAGRVNILFFEIIPPEEGPSAPLTQWVYRVDQDKMPKWHNAIGDQTRATTALSGSGLAVLYADYQAKAAPLYADYQAKRAPFYADYQAKAAPLYADYQAKVASLYADYQAKAAPLDADCEAKVASLYADYQAKRAPLEADYQAKVASLDADCEAKVASLDADYNAKRAEITKGPW